MQATDRGRVEGPADVPREHWEADPQMNEPTDPLSDGVAGAADRKGSGGIQRGLWRRRDSDDEDEEAVKQIRTISADHDARYAWNWRYPEGGLPWDVAKLLDDTDKTSKLKSVYVSDIKGALHSLQTQRGRPPFPESLWKSILLNLHVDLGQVLDDHYALAPTYTESIALGDEMESPSTNPH